MTDDTPSPSLSAVVPAMARLMRPHMLVCGGIAVALVAEACFNALIPMCFKWLVDGAITTGNRHALASVLATLGGSALGVSVVGLGRDALYSRLGARVFNDLRGRLFDHMQALCIKFWTRVDDGYVLSRFSSDLAAVEQAFMAAVPWGVLPALDVLVSTVLLFTLDWRLALVAMLIWPMALLGPRIFTPRATTASYRRRQDEADLLGVLQEHVVAHRLTKAFGLEGFARQRFGDQAERLVGSSVRVAFYSALVERSAGTGIYLLQVLVLGVGAWMAFSNWLTIGTLAAFQSLFMSLSYSLSYVSQYVPSLVQAAGGLQRIEEFLDERPSVVDGPDARTFEGPVGPIVFSGATFKHEDGGTVIGPIDLEIPPGASVALVGPSGSGKSTVLNLLLRFYEPDEGSVTVGGEDLRMFDQSSWRGRLGLVPQDTILLNLSLRENIRLGRADATDEEVEHAARVAGIHDVILAMPEGYETLPGDRGERLSGGQRQRMAIARAILRDPAVLLLDEATSALDAATEASLNHTLAEIGRGRTVVSVTHRLDALVGVDLIFVLVAGQVVEKGTHAELLALGGVYKGLWETHHASSLRDAAVPAAGEVQPA